MAFLPHTEAGGVNVLAFLDMLAYAEGVQRFSKGHDGYDVIVGGTTFTDFSDHPRRKIFLPRYQIHSTAAGRYQFLIRTWDALAKQMKLPDFSPRSQDRAAIQLIREQRAYEDVKFGRFDVAVRKCRNIWASLPDAGYGQREVALATLRDTYVLSGGVLA